MTKHAKPQSGIYRIVNGLNGDIYIGQTNNFLRRWKRHRNDLRRGVHDNCHLQRAYVLYGESAFLFEVIEYVADQHSLDEREQYYLDAIAPEYNLSRTASSNRGYRMSAQGRANVTRWANSPENRARVRALAIERWSDPLIREQMLALLAEAAGRPETRAKISATSREHWADPIYREKTTAAIRLTHNLPEVRARKSTASKRLWERPEHRANVLPKWAEAQRTSEARAARSRESIERWADPEYRARMCSIRKEVAQRPGVRVRKSTIARDAFVSSGRALQFAETQAARWADPEEHAKQSERNRAMWEDPAHRAKMTAVARSTKNPQVVRSLEILSAVTRAVLDPDRASARTSARGLARELELSASSVSRALKRLVAQGLIDTAYHPLPSVIQEARG